MTVSVKQLQWIVRGQSSDAPVIYAGAFGIDRFYSVKGAPGNWTLSYPGADCMTHLDGFQTQSATREAAQADYEVRAMVPLVFPTPSSHVQAKEPPLDWGNFVGPKRNVEWKPDDQNLIYTAINFRDDEWGDADEDAAQQIVERLLSSWNRAAVSEEITFEIAARLLKERDHARAALKSAVDHIEHMAAWFSNRGTGYSFEALGEDMPGIKAALATTEGKP
jgi:hypothetical protein